MREITVDPKLARGTYQRHLILNGHVPGVLSGAEVRNGYQPLGTGWFSSRKNLAARVEKAVGVKSARAYDPERRAIVRVWVGPDSRPCRLVFSRTTT